jgi:hypothetical protein
MKESKQQLSQRKIRNGLRKQAASVRAVQEKEIWNALKYGQTIDLRDVYGPYVPLKVASAYRTLEQQINLELNKSFLIGWEATV